MVVWFTFLSFMAVNTFSQWKYVNSGQSIFCLCQLLHIQSCRVQYEKKLSQMWLERANLDKMWWWYTDLTIVYIYTTSLVTILPKHCKSLCYFNKYSNRKHLTHLCTPKVHGSQSSKSFLTRCIPDGQQLIFTQRRSNEYSLNSIFSSLFLFPCI